MRNRILVIVLAVILLILAAGTPLLIRNYVFLNGSIYPKDLQVLDLSGKPLEDISRISQLTQLRQLDLRDTGITPAEYEKIQKQLPGCQIQWLLPFQGNYLPLDTDALTLSQITEADMALLGYLPQLRTVDATACRDYEALRQLQDMYPNCQVRFQLDLDGILLDQDATAADLPNATGAAVTQALAFLPNLTQINAQGCREYDTLMQLQQQYPNCQILYSVRIDDQEWPSDTASLSVASADDLAQALAYLPAVTLVSVETPLEDAAQMLALKEMYPQIQFAYTFRLFGKTVSTQDTALDLSGISISGTDVLEAALPHFNNLEKVDMCGCGIADEDMAALNERHPDTLFVWEIYFGGKAVRTDATYFMPYQLRYKVTDKDADKLKYLTELLCLDLGHMEISRSDFLQHMTKMKYLLLADTLISDISGCANMPDLVYAEFFMSKVKDYSPLLECENLVDLNVCYTKPKDPLIFCQMPQLQNLWFRGNYNKSIYNQLKEGLPNTRIAFDYGTATDGGWRELQNYFDMRDLLGMHYMQAS